MKGRLERVELLPLVGLSRRSLSGALSGPSRTFLSGRRRAQRFVANLVSMIGLAIALAGSCSPWFSLPSMAQDAAPSQVVPFQSAGLPDFGRVTDTLYRGAQPSLEGFRALQKMNVAVVVNFRGERGERHGEQAEVESLGMRYLEIPWSAFHNPTDAQISKFLRIIQSSPGTKIFVHCRYGADRTGAMVAAYRIAVEHKSPAQALAEMRAFHYHAFWFPHLGRYVANFPSRLVSDPQLAAFTRPN